MFMQSAIVDALGHKDTIDDRKLLVSEMPFACWFAVYRISTA